MIPAILKIYADDESLLEYERSISEKHCVSLESISVRLMLMLRHNNMQMPDNYYNSICEEEMTGIENLADLMLKIPERIVEKYLVSKNGQLRVKGELFSEWMDLIVEVPPSLFIAMSLQNVFQREDAMTGITKFAETYLKPFAHTSLIPPYLPEFDYWINQSEGLEDLHIHLNGSTETDIIWRYMLAHPYESAKQMEEKEHQREVKKLATIVASNFNPEQFLQRLKTAERLKIEMTKIISRRILPNGVSVDQLHHIWGNWGLQSNYGPMIDEILLFVFALNELKCDKNEYFASLLHHYLLIKGMVHRMVVMQHSQWGFEQFQSITIAPMRDGVERNYQRRFLQLSGTGCYPVWGMIEGRFSPKKDVASNRELIHRIENGWGKARLNLALANRDVNGSTLSLVAHFIKEPESVGSKKTFIRHSSLRNSLFVKAVALAETMKDPHMGNLICGIDAAASELDAGPEVFSPTFRYMRKRGLAHFTFHVGEDFRHLVSGVRAIWESVDFLELQRSDRLGHCVAVGLEPALWEKRVKGHCYMSQGEILDDLVFVWNMIKNHPNKILAVSQLKVESKIQELCHEIYGENYTPLDLSRAWRLRKYDPFDYMNNLTVCSHYFKLEKGKEREKVESLFADKTIGDVMRKYHASTTDTVNKRCRYQYDKKIRVNVGEIISVEQMKEIQNIVLKEIIERGIVIETLPSSNLRIGYYKTMDEYHLDRWTERGRNELRPAVVIGTDDPGIFMTNIYNEYARVFCYLREKSYGEADGIEIIRRFHETSKIYHFGKR